MLKRKRNDVRINKDSIMVDITDLSKNDEVEFFIEVLYEGNKRSLKESIKFIHDGKKTKIYIVYFMNSMKLVIPLRFIS